MQVTSHRDGKLRLGAPAEGGGDSTVHLPADSAPRILVVEDDSDFRGQLRDYFEYLQWTPLLARNRDEALKAFRGGVVDLVLCDIMLPGSDGFETVAALRRLRGGETVPVVMISAVWRDPQRFARKLEAIGAIEFLRKPLSILELGQRIAAILQAPEQLRHGGAATRSGQFRNLGVDAMVRQNHAPFERLGSYRPAVLVGLFVTLFEQRRSGLLVLSGDDGKREIGFLDGYPVLADSEEPDETLPAVLIREGTIGPSDVPPLLAARREQQRPLRELVVERGLLSVGEALAAEERRVRRVLTAAFGGCGYYEFFEGEACVSRSGRFDLHPLPLLLRILGDIPLREFGGELGKRSNHLLVPGPRYGRLHTELPLPQSLDWLDAAMAQGLALPELLKRHEGSGDQLLKVIWLLVRLGIADTVDDARRPNTPPELTARRRPPTLVVETVPETEELDASAREILRDYLWLMEADCYRVLDVDAGASPEEIEAAWKRRAAAWRSVALGDHPPRVRVKAIELLERLADAHDTLSDPAKRRSYDERLQAGVGSRLRDSTDTERLALAREALRLGQPEDAVAAYRLVLRRHPRCVEALAGLAAALCAHRFVAGPAALAEARQLMESALQLRPDDPRLLELHIEILDAAGEREGLRRARERVADLRSTGNWAKVLG